MPLLEVLRDRREPSKGLIAAKERVERHEMDRLFYPYGPRQYAAHKAGEEKGYAKAMEDIHGARKSSSTETTMRQS